ncbi:MAG: chemotaxis protein CheB [Pseudomonadota bacterium]
MSPISTPACSASARRHIVVIGASAGGVPVLQDLFALLPPDTSASYFVVQHLAAHTPSQLDRVLQGATAMPVHFARNDEPILPDTVYLAAPDRHLLVEDGRTRITRGPRECRARPAVDVLFRSAALAYGPQVIGVVLSGSLDDGTAGLWQIKDRGGLALVQDPREASYPSMPESALEHVEADCVAPVAALARRIIEETATPRPLPCPPQPRARQQVENQVAMGGNGMQAGVMGLGEVSTYTCPECHGVLVQIEEGRLLRFRCHTGHAYSPKSLLVEVNEAIDSGIWDAIRVIEERILLLRQMADMAAAAGKEEDARRLRAKAGQAEDKCKPLRDLVLDADFFAA